jgi:hypothetical protein
MRARRAEGRHAGALLRPPAVPLLALQPRADRSLSRPGRSLTRSGRMPGRRGLGQRGSGRRLEPVEESSREDSTGALEAIRAHTG